MIPELPGDAGRIGAKVLVATAQRTRGQQASLDALMADLSVTKSMAMTYYGNASTSFTNPDATSVTRRSSL